MKTVAILVSLALAGAAVAQDGIPQCAQGCANTFLLNGIPGCSNADIACICGNGDFIKSISCCLMEKCPEAEQQQAVKFAAELCSGAGVTVPTAVICSTSAPKPTGSTTSSPASAPTGSSTGSAPTGAGTTQPPATGTGATVANTSTVPTAAGPRQTVAAGLGAIGGILAAVALL